VTAQAANALREHLAALGPVPREIPIGELWAVDFIGHLGFPRADKFARINLDFIELASDQLVEFAIETPKKGATVGILTFHESAGARRTLRYRVLGHDPQLPSSLIAERLFEAS
jgi:hypothetical protein